MQLWEILYLLLSGILFFFLILPFLTVLWSRLFGKERVEPTMPATEFDYGCIITAYRNVDIAKRLGAITCQAAIF